LTFLRFTYRWATNALAFYLALYLVDSLIAPRFYIEKGWAAVVLGILLGALNSLVRPFPRFKTRRNRALTVVGLTVIANWLFLHLVMWLGAPVSATNPIWVLGTAIFLTLLAALLNHIVGFKPKEQPKVVTRELGLADRAREIDWTLESERMRQAARKRAKARKKGGRRPRT
jgi:uncharacterized membrane protein YvlD (DUF360 family)